MSIDIIIPIYNESDSIPDLVDELASVLKGKRDGFRVIFIDDGSTDETPAALASAGSRLDCLVLRHSRNFGKEAALASGLAASSGTAVITMDCDLQHPPSKIPEFIEKWRSGYKIVHGVHSSQKHKSSMTSVFSRLFYVVFKALTGIQLESQSDFKLLDREVVDALLGLRETNRFYRGLVKWVGYPSSSVSFTAPERRAGRTKWSFLGLCRYAARSILAFSDLPLKMIPLMGGAIILMGSAMGIQTLWNYFAGKASDGFTTVIMLLILLNGVVVFFLGIIAVYLGAIFREVKARPTALIEHGSVHMPPASPAPVEPIIIDKDGVP